MGDHLGTPCADGMDSDIDAAQKQVTGVSKYVILVSVPG